MTKTITKIRPPKNFWLLATTAVVWNLIGVLIFLQHIMITPEVAQELSRDEQQLLSYPMWALVSFGVAVFFGFFASFFLVMKNKWARPLFVLSLIGVIGHVIYMAFYSKGIELFGVGFMIIPTITLLISIFLVGFSHRGIMRQWLR